MRGPQIAWVAIGLILGATGALMVRQAVGQSPVTGSWQVEAGGNGAYRLNTTTGHLEFCQPLMNRPDCIVLPAPRPG
jgi:hypothetical protein